MWTCVSALWVLGGLIQSLLPVGGVGSVLFWAAYHQARHPVGTPLRPSVVSGPALVCDLSVHPVTYLSGAWGSVDAGRPAVVVIGHGWARSVAFMLARGSYLIGAGVLLPRP